MKYSPLAYRLATKKGKVKTFYMEDGKLKKAPQLPERLKEYYRNRGVEAFNSFMDLVEGRRESQQISTEALPF